MSFASGSTEKEMMLMVRPWKFSSKTMISALSFSTPFTM